MTFSTGVLGGHEGQPLVVDNTMYVVTPWPNVLYAFDLTKEDYPLRWKYRPDVSPKAIGIACCDVVNRGAVYADGKIVYNLLDGHTVAVDTANRPRDLEDEGRGPRPGRDHRHGAAGGEGPGAGRALGRRVRHPRLVQGARSRDRQGRLDGAQHRTRQRDAGVARERSSPFYDKGPELALTSWAGDTWKRGGAPVWGWLSYDAELDLVYYGTGNPGPYNAEQRPGDNKWTNSVLARRPGDGTLVWAYQFTPADNWDYDSNAEMILADLTISGQRRKVLVQFNKNGFAYTLDRATGEVLAGRAVRRR